jgi:hypothetical protein
MSEKKLNVQNINSENKRPRKKLIQNTHRRKTSRITNAGNGRQTAGVKRFRPAEEKVVRVRGVQEQTGTALLNTDDDDDNYDDTR